MLINLPRSLLLVAAVLLSACSETEPLVPRSLVVAVLPDQSADELRTRYEPLIAYLEQRAGIDLELRMPNDYQDLLDLFGAGEVHLAWFGGLTFALAAERHGAVPLAMRDIDRDFASHYLARADSPGRTVRDFAGRRFAFGSRLSTSGHLMPRYFLQEQGIVPEDFFTSVEYSGAHDLTAQWVRDGRVDLGVANATIIDRMYASGRLSRDRVRVLESTPPYHNYVWATQPGLAADTRTRLLDAFLALSPADPSQARILNAQDAGGYLPVADSDYDGVKAAARLLGLLEPEGGE